MDASTWLTYKRSKVVATGDPKVRYSSTSEIVTETLLGSQELVANKDVYGKCCNRSGADALITVPLPFFHNPNMILSFRSGPLPRFNPRAMSTNTVTLPIVFSSPISVNWGDDTVLTYSTPPVTHTYTSFGSYTVDISGSLSAFGSSSGWTGSNLLTSISNWGDSPFTTLVGACFNSFYLTSVPSTVPSTVTAMTNMFAGASIFTQDISQWAVSRVIEATDMFDGSPNMSLMNFNGIPEIIYRPRPLVMEFRVPEPSFIMTLPLTVSSGGSVLWGNGAKTTFNGSVPITYTYDVSGRYIVSVKGNITGFSGPLVNCVTAVLDWGRSPFISLNSAFQNAHFLTSVPSTLPSTVLRTSNLFKQTTKLYSPTASFSVDDIVAVPNGSKYDLYKLTSFTLPNNPRTYGFTAIQNADPYGFFNDLLQGNLSGTIVGLSRDPALNGVEPTAYLLTGTDPNTGYTGSTYAAPTGQILWSGTGEVYTLNQVVSVVIGVSSNDSTQTLNELYQINFVPPQSPPPSSGWTFITTVDPALISACISGWNTANVTDMSSMFQGYPGYTGTGLSNWHVSAATDMSHMFDGMYAAYTNGLFIENLKGWPSSATHVKFFSPDGITDTSETDPHSPFNSSTNLPMILTFNAGYIELPLIGSGLTVDYGNGVKTSNYTATLAQPSIVKIYGPIEIFGDSSWVGASLLKSVVSWGSSPIVSLDWAFVDPAGPCPITSVPTTLPSTVVTCFRTFYLTNAFTQDLSGWDVSNVTNMSNMFQDSVFNGNISNWDVSNVRTMDSMFRENYVFNGDISNWDVSGSAIMAYMFNNARSFTASGLSKWNLCIFLQGGNSQYVNIGGMFSGTSAAYTNTDASGLFIEDLSGWSTLNSGNTFFFSPNGIADTTLTDPHSPFYVNLSPPMILKFTPGVTINLPISVSGPCYVDLANGTGLQLLQQNMGPVGASGIVNVYANITSFGGVSWVGVDSLIEVTSWGPSQITSLSGAFNVDGLTPGVLTSVASIPASVVDTSYMFYQNGFTGDISGWNMTNVTDMSYMFKGSTFNGDISNWIVSNVKTMVNMFDDSDFTAAGLSQWTPTACTDMQFMFRSSAAYTNTDASGLFIEDLSNWPNTALNYYFFSPNGTTDTTTADLHSPFYIEPLIMIFTVGTSIVLPIISRTYIFDLGDGQFTRTTNQVTGTVVDTGIVRVWGPYSFGTISFGFPGWTGITGLLAVVQWGAAPFVDFNSAFHGATALTSVPSTLPPTVTSTLNMFRGANIFTQDLSGWNVSNVTIMSYMFFGASAFNGNISNWDVSGVTSMESMFFGASAFTAAGLSQWTPTACTDMIGMFKGTSAAYTNTDASGLFIEDLSNWPNTAATYYYFFSPDGITDTSETDPHSPFYIRVPNAPANVSATITTTTSATISWTPPSGTLINYTITSTPSTSPKTVSAPATSTIFTGLTPGESYTFSVVANNSLGPSLAGTSGSLTMIAPVPPAPSAVSVSVASATSVNISWTPPSGTVTSYTVTSTPPTSSQTVTAPATSMTFTGLTAGQSYTFTITANNSYGPGTSVTTGSVIPTSNLPMILRFSGRDAYTSLTLPISGISDHIWVEFGANGLQRFNPGDTVTGSIDQNTGPYTVRIYNSINTALFTTFGQAESQEPLALNYLTSIDSWGTNTILQNLTSACRSLDNVTSVPTVLPSTVTNISNMFQGATNFVGSSITDWDVTNVVNMSTMFINANSFNADLSAWVTSNVTSMRYMFYNTPNLYTNSGVFKYNLRNWSVAQVTLKDAFFFINGKDTTFTDSNSPFYIAPVAPAAPTNVSATIITTTSATISWTPPSGTLTNYTVTTTPATSSQTVSAPATSMTFTGLTPGESYTFSVVANNSVGPSLPGTSESLTMILPVPPPASAVSVSVASPTSVTISWTPPNGSVTSYTVTSTPPTSSQTVTAPATSMTFTGLTAGQSYTFTITANNSYGPGTSVTTSSITPIQLPTFTTTPGDTTMLVQFTPTAEVTYTITVKQYEQVAPDWGYTLVQTFPATLTGTPGNYTITGLANFYFYACSINCTQSGNTLSTPFSSAFQNPVLPAPMILKFNNSTTYEIRLPISGNSSNVMVDWGAGVSFRYKENYNFLTGPLPTQYVKIYGSFQNFGNAWDGRDKLLSIDSWGNNPTLTTLQGMCQGATSLTSVPNTIPSSVTNCNAMFSLTTSFTAAGLSNWTATNITDMSYMFERASSTYSNGLFKENLSGWSSTALHVKFFSPDGTLDTSETDPYSPFNPNNIFILEFNAGAITLPVTGTNITVDFGSGYSSSLTGTLSVAGQVKIRGSITAFGNPSTSWTGANLLTRIVSWGTSSITNLSRAFLNATSLTSVPTLLPSTVTNTSYMFSGATAFAATGLNNWFPTNVTNMSYMFYGTSAAYTSTGPTGTFRVDLNGWPGTATSTLFFSPNAATDTTTTDPFSPFNTLYSLVLRINVVNEGGLGLRLADLQLIDPTITIYWGDQYNNVYKQADDKTHYYDKGKYVLRFLGRFRAFIWNQIPGASYCGMSLLTHIVRWSNDLTTISISESTNPATGVLYPGATNPATGVLYPGATNLVYVPPTLPTSARNLNEMFNGATIFNQNLSSWDVTNITSMNSMFRNAAAFTATGLNTWTPTNVTDMSYMFYGTSAAFTNVSSSGRLLTDLTSWPYTASNTLFLSPDRSTDTTLIDIKSPFYGR